MTVPDSLTDEDQSATEWRGRTKDFERAVSFLLATATRPAIVLTKEWHVSLAFDFKDRAFFQAEATAAGLFLVHAARPSNGGVEHLLLIARKRDVTEHEINGCLDDEIKSTTRVEILSLGNMK